jgi:hypothetical protein
MSRPSGRRADQLPYTAQDRVGSMELKHHRNAVLWEGSLGPSVDQMIRLAWPLNGLAGSGKSG